MFFVKPYLFLIHKEWLKDRQNNMSDDNIHLHVTCSWGMLQ